MSETMIFFLFTYQIILQYIHSINYSFSFSDAFFAQMSDIKAKYNIVTVCHMGLILFHFFFLVVMIIIANDHPINTHSGAASVRTVTNLQNIQ